MIRALLYYLFRVGGASLRDEARILAGLARFSIGYAASAIGFGEPPRGLWDVIPGGDILTVKVGGMIFRVRPKTKDLRLAT
jgi:hypothetical protein